MFSLPLNIFLSVYPQTRQNVSLNIQPCYPPTHIAFPPRSLHILQTSRRIPRAFRPLHTLLLPLSTLHRFQPRLLLLPPTIKNPTHSFNINGPRPRPKPRIKLSFPLRLRPLLQHRTPPSTTRQYQNGLPKRPPNPPLLLPLPNNMQTPRLRMFLSNRRSRRSTSHRISQRNHLPLLTNSNSSGSFRDCNDEDEWD